MLLRVGAMVGLALAVTLTTRTADLIAVCEWALLPCSAWACSMPARWRWPGAGAALRSRSGAISAEIREAQAARGLGANPLALIVPLIVLTLKRAQEVSKPSTRAVLNATPLDRAFIIREESSGKIVPREGMP